MAEKKNIPRRQQRIIKTPLNRASKIKKTIGIMSGKGGVGKSSVTSMLAVTLKRAGYNVGILDADITGPSIPRIFGVTEKVSGNEYGIFPAYTRNEMPIMSVNLLVDNATEPAVFRGPLINQMVRQFWAEVIWEDLDFLLIDMPPGTGDIPITIFQSLDIDGIILITSPQDLVSMIVKKSAKMAKMMKIPIIGIVENMALFKCSNCEMEHNIYGDSKIEIFAGEENIPVLARLPLEPKIAELCDTGEMDQFDSDWFENTKNILIKMLSDEIEK